MASSHSKATTPKAVTVVVAGDKATGKSTLIASMLSESFPETVPSVLPPTRLPHNSFCDSVPVIVIDTTSSLGKEDAVNEEFKRADAVVLTYSCGDPVSFERLSTHWLPELQKLEVKVPVIVVGCKLDLRDETELVSLESLTSDILQQFREVVTCIECSAVTHYQVPEVFHFAQKAVLHPVDPLFDYEKNSLTDECLTALRRIFFIIDYNIDGTLSDAELNDFQVKCFGGPLQQADLAQLKTIVEENVPEGVNSLGFTLPGFIYIHNMFLKKGRTETFWAVLRKFGYGNDLKLRDELFIAPSKQASDQSVELTPEAMEFLKHIFRMLDKDRDGLLRPADIDKLFGVVPESRWNDVQYKDAAEKTDMGYLSITAFLSQWVLMTLLDPTHTFANLVYIGYRGRAPSLRITRRRSEDRKKRKTERNVVQCYVFGSKSAGKSALLYSLLRRPFSDYYTPTTVEKYAANTIEIKGIREIKKFLILREIPENEVLNFLSNPDYLAACDVAAFVYDSSDEHSWKTSIDLLEKVFNQGEVTGNKVPCLLIAAKDDLTPFPREVADPVEVTRELRIDEPIHVSVKSGDLNDVHRKIFNAAEQPHLSLPETVFVRERKQHRKLINSLIFGLVGTAMAFAGFTVRRARGANRNA